MFITKEFIRFYLVFVHIMLSTLAVGTILYSYITFLRFGYFSRKHVMLEHITVSLTFLGLGISGASIVYLDIGIISSLDQLFQYDKLTSKITNTLILIINGLFIHNYVVPRIMKVESLSRRDILIFGISSGISLAAWITAIFIGKARILMPILDTQQFVLLDLSFITLGGLIGALSSIFIKVKIAD